jgi:glutamyl-tRNA synthetase
VQSEPDEAQLEKAMTPQVAAALADLRNALTADTDWSAERINSSLQQVLKQHGVKMPALAVPVRLVVFGVPQSPALSEALAVAGRDRVLGRLTRAV